MVRLVIVCVGVLGLSLVCQGEASGLHAFDRTLITADTVKGDSTNRKVKKPLPDSVNVSWENGKLKTPDNLSKKQLKDVGVETISDIRKKASEKKNGAATDQVQVMDDKIGSQKQKLKKSDSLLNLAENPEEMLASLKSGKAIPVRKLYSDRRIKAIYDSAGVGRIDSLLALSGLKKEITSEGLLDKINSSMSGDPDQENLDPTVDLSKYTLPSADLQNLSPISGRKLKPENARVADSLTRAFLNSTSFGSLDFNYRDSVGNLIPVKVIPYGKKDDLDSLKANYASRLQSGDSMLFVPSNKMDSVKALLLSKKLLIQGKEYPQQKIDSIKNNARELLRKKELNQKEITDELSQVAIPEKNKFLNRFYFEGVVSFNKDPLHDEVKISPAFGFHLTENLSVGAGLNLLLSKKEKNVHVSTGYRSFVKYQLFDRRAYVQVEDWIDPVRVTTESIQTTRHSILAGGGYILAISKSIGLNGSLMYRVNNQNFSDGAVSPWVIRIGISSIRNQKIK